MLTDRLKRVKSHVDKEIIADIGTDHAYVPIALAEDGTIKKAVACDVREGPLSIAHDNIKKHGFLHIIETRLGSGLSVLKEDEANQIIIAGMGAVTIMNILKDDENIARRADKLILQPMNGQADLRKFLIKNGYTIFNEDLAVEGRKVYQIFDVKSGRSILPENEIDYYISPLIYNHIYIHNLIAWQRDKWEKMYYGIMKSQREKNEADKIKKRLDELNRLEENL